MKEREVTIERRLLPYAIKRADTFGMRLKGLMFRRKPLIEEALHITPCNSIHMCFMYFPIDVVFLDKNKQVVKIIHHLRPWKFIAPVQGAHSVLELPSGAINELNIRLGQTLYVG